MAEPVLGVGIDIEEPAVLGHLPEEALLRAAGRWLDPDEQAWCARQRSLAEALVVALCCKEAAYKAGGAESVAEVRLGLHGSPDRGRAEGAGGPASLRVAWRRWEGRVVAVAVAAAAGEPILDPGAALLEAENCLGPAGVAGGRGDP